MEEHAWPLELHWEVDDFLMDDIRDTFLAIPTLALKQAD
jgi:hypothetical protein